ncbi:MAG TPA: hypothetical protein VGW76_10305, partial [Pyrinomonadaceae bacterium]|nr:hypothetical protein [Pyrinomonadaceae bacterium]
MNRPTLANATHSSCSHSTKPQAVRLIILNAIIVAGFAFLCLFMSGSSSNAPSPIVATSSQSAPSTAAQARAAYGQLPLSFEVNRGQADKAVNYLVRGAGYTLALSPTEAAFALTRESVAPSQNGASPSRLDQGDAAITVGDDVSAADTHPSEPPAVLRMKVVGARPSAVTKGEDELAGKVNYFRGSDPAKWRTDVSTFARVRYTEVYPGIDLVYYGNQRQLEYDF